MNTAAKKKMHPVLKFILWAVGIFILIGIISEITGTNKTENSPVSDEPQRSTVSKAWTEVCRLKGNGSKKSSVFELMGGEAKIEYEYNSGMGENGFGVLAIYVVDDGHQIEKEGGFPEVTVTSVKEKSESSLYKEAGKYYLSVDGAGNWTVIIKEKK